MTIEEIQARLDAMPAALSAKGKVNPAVSLTFNGNSLATGMMTWKRAVGEAGYSEQAYTHLTGKSHAEVLDKADAIIAAFPSIEEARKAEFTAQLAKTIELGNAYGMDVEFVNPLTEAMKRLSENALTHQADA